MRLTPLPISARTCSQHAGFSVATLTVFCSAGSVAAAQAHVHCDPAPPPSAQPCVDPREGRRLPPDVPHVRCKRAVACAVGETLAVADVMAADVTVIDSMHDIYALFAALMRIEHPRTLRAARHLTPHGAWAECAFLADWSTFAHETKLKMLADKPCYELFLFVKFCDEAFFLAHVVPLLAMRAPSEHDTMSLILTADTDALAPRMRDMHAVSRMTPLEVLLAGAVLRDAAVLRSAVMRWRLPRANRVLRQWCVADSDPTVQYVRKLTACGSHTTLPPRHDCHILHTLCSVHAHNLAIAIHILSCLARQA